MIRIVLLLMLGVFTRSCDASIYPNSTIKVQNGKGFTAFLIPKPGFGELLKCNLQRQGNPTAFNLMPSQNMSYVTEYSEVITAYAGDKCGAQVRNVSHLSTGTWQLVAIDENLVRYNEDFTVEILKLVASPKVIELNGGSSEWVLVNCSQELNETQPKSDYEIEIEQKSKREYEEVVNYNNRNYYSTKPLPTLKTFPTRFKYNYNFCEIEDIQTGQKYLKCSKMVRNPSAGRSNEYVCRHLIPGSMQISETKIIVKGSLSAAKDEIITTSRSVVLSCETGQNNTPYCEAVHQKSNLYVNIYDGLLDDRYSSFSTKLKDGLCQLEIPLPILANETGAWKILTWSRDHNDDPHSEAVQTGCSFKLNSDAAEEIQSLKDRAGIPRRIDSLEIVVSIQCEKAPYKLNYCYLKAPDNEIIFPNQTLFEVTSTIGICQFDSILIRNGLWKCGFNGPTEKDPDIIQNIEMYFHRNFYIHVEHDVVNVTQNDDFSLLCQTITRDPIKSCMFISANGSIYNLPTSSFASSTYRYQGNGLELGDCGITINGHEEFDDYGIWMCNVVLQSSPINYKNYFSVVMEEDTYVYQVESTTDNYDYY